MACLKVRDFTEMMKIIHTTETTIIGSIRNIQEKFKIDNERNTESKFKNTPTYHQKEANIANFIIVRAIKMKSARN